jgi:hypothetical protein
VLDRHDLGGDVLGGPGGLLREVLDLAGDHGEALAGVAGTGRLDGGVEGQQVGLLGDGGDDLQHVADLRRGGTELGHGGRGLGGGVHGALSDPGRFGGAVRDLADRTGHLLAAGGDGLHVARHLLRGGCDRRRLGRERSGLGRLGTREFGVVAGLPQGEQLLVAYCLVLRPLGLEPAHRVRVGGVRQVLRHRLRQGGISGAHPLLGPVLLAARQEGDVAHGDARVADLAAGLNQLLHGVQVLRHAPACLGATVAAPACLGAPVAAPACFGAPVAAPRCPAQAPRHGFL